MIKCNIILDGSYLLYKNVFILKKLKSISDLFDLLERDFNTLTRTFPYDNIYFVSDSRELNWRKIIYNEYKNKRKKDLNIDWDFVFKTYDDFKKTLNIKNNVKLLEYNGLEGDDFIAYIINKTNENGYSNIIIASDKDLQQLLSFDLNKNYINIQWNYRFSDQRVYLPKNYQLFLEQLHNSENNNIFSLDNDIDFYNFIINLIQKTKINDINKEQILFEKIVQGDISDNIISIIKIKNGEYNINGRGIGKDGAKKVYNIYKKIHPEKIDFNSINFINRLTDIVIYYKKIKNPSTKLKEIIKENIILNRQLISLDTQYMPKKIYENLKNYFNEIEKKIKKNKTKNNKNIIIDNNNDSDDFNPDSYWEI